MTPSEFADTYHQLAISDSLLGLNVTLNIKVYKADWAAPDIAEASRVLSLVARKFLNLSDYRAVPATFSIKNSPLVDPDEQFCCAGIRRAICSRGSPSEMSDALRIVALTGANGKLPLKEYGEKWFGQDCNSFAGNWLGLSPMIPVSSYITGRELGNSYSEQDCRPFLPLPLRNDASRDLFGIRMGDPIVTFADMTKAEKAKGVIKHWRHIGIVQSISGSAGNARLAITEWGGPGGKPEHNSSHSNIELIPDLLAWKPAGSHHAVHALLKRAITNRKLVGFATMTTDHNEYRPCFRIFLGQGETENLDYRGWHTGNHRFGH